MTEVINLRLARKARTRSEKQREAAENRARHGQAKAAKRRQAMEKARSLKNLDGSKRDKP